jgi:hypothetical protein
MLLPGQLKLYERKYVPTPDVLQTVLRVKHFIFIRDTTIFVFALHFGSRETFVLINVHI